MYHCAPSGSPCGKAPPVSHPRPDQNTHAHTDTASVPSTPRLITITLRSCLALPSKPSSPSSHVAPISSLPKWGDTATRTLTTRPTRYAAACGARSSACTRSTSTSCTFMMSSLSRHASPREERATISLRSAPKLPRMVSLRTRRPPASPGPVAARA